MTFWKGLVTGWPPTKDKQVTFESVGSHFSSSTEPGPKVISPYFWWFRNLAIHHLRCFCNLVNNRINYQPQLVHPGRLTWNLQITHLERKMIWTKPPLLCSMLIFQGVNAGFQPSKVSPRPRGWKPTKAWSFAGCGASLVSTGHPVVDCYVLLPRAGYIYKVLGCPWKLVTS